MNAIDAMWDDNPVDVSNEVGFIWTIANKLRGPYQHEKFKDVIIPMTVIRRFECALQDTKKTVVAQYEADLEKGFTRPAKAMYKISGYQFYNTSRFTLAELLNDSDHLAANLKQYIQSFSPNVQDIIKSLEFDKQIDKMEKHDRLFTIVKSFSELDLNPKTIDNVKMGYIFEDLIRRFSENAEAGDHYTGRDIIKTMVNILLSEGCEDIFDDGKVITILDQCAGTGGMLSTAFNFIKRYNPTADVRLFGQEINPESYAMCLSEMLIKGQNAENIRLQDTMKADCFPNHKMRFCLENPPFGQSWGGSDAGEGVEQAVRAEYTRGENGRWGHGLPGTGDMQLLFMQSTISKLDDKLGRAAIIENGSPLFTGGTASGESQIRRWILESDLLEAIIALPGDLYYNTPLATYIWIISKNKNPKRRGKVQLIDATTICHKLRKSLGNKRNEITPEDRKRITALYANFEENEFCKIYPNEEFIYKEYAVMQPLQRSYAITEDRIQLMLQRGSLNSLYNEAKVYELENPDTSDVSGDSKKKKTEEQLKKEEEKRAKKLADNAKKLEQAYRNKPIYDDILARLRANVSDIVYPSPKAFRPVLESVLEGIDTKIVKKVMEGLSVMDKTAEIQKDKKGNILYDKDTKDTEIIQWSEDIEDYMTREVTPHVPDAQWFWEENESGKNPVIKTGAEIPFTRYFYQYKAPQPSELLEKEFVSVESSVSERIAKLFGGM